MTSTKSITYCDGRNNGGEAREPEIPPLPSGAALNLLDDGTVVEIIALSVTGAGE